MAPKGKRAKRVRHNSRSLVQKVFEASGAPRTLTTNKIMDEVGKASGKVIPEYSVRNALRTLVRRKILQARRIGRELSYTYVGGSASGGRAKAAARSVPVVTATEITAVAVEPVAPVAAGSETPLPHKLAVGEALILHVGEAHVESVTNVHGKLVVERHPRTRKAAP